MVASTNKYFPIHTETACQLKWTWSTIHLYTGETNSCHRVEMTTLTPATFADFHNTPKKISDRKLMLKGKWPTGGCNYCADVEKINKTSDRMFQKTIPNLVPEELDTNPDAVVVTPRILEVYLDNICNMSCIYCQDKFSSRIAAENIKFGEYHSGDLTIKNTSVRSADFNHNSTALWEWMNKNYSSLRRLHILGGEPFFQSAFATCLEFIADRSNPLLEFNIVTNLKLPLAKLKKFVSRVKQLIITHKIKRLDITCSIDCWGPEQEYIRNGINMKEWQQNFEYLVSEKWIVLNINQTITGLGIPSMGDLYTYINHQRTIRPINLYFMPCVIPAYLSPSVFGKDYFAADFENILGLMPEDTQQNKSAKQLMEGMIANINTNTHTLNLQELKNMLQYLTELDRRRNTSWQTTFPWLVKELKNVV